MLLFISLAFLTSAIKISQEAPPSHHTDFAAFVDFYGRDYGAPGSPEYNRRALVFERHLATVRDQNDLHQAGKSPWRAGVSRLADRTEEELRRLRGYRASVRPNGGGGGGVQAPAPVGFLGRSAKRVQADKILPEWTWKGLLKVTKEPPMDQGACGSCWAVASANVLRAHSELYQTDRTWSAQQIVSCTLNPKNCGGKGGCDGATAELAFDYVMRTGGLTNDEFSYSSGTTESAGTCPQNMGSQQSLEMPGGRADGSPSSLFEVSVPLGGVIALEGAARMNGGMTGWRRLPENVLASTMLAILQNGPVVVSLHAGAEWNMYSGGVLDNCDKDVIIDHAVMLVGWGDDTKLGKKYWHIQNSWGNDWGEVGFIRVLRRDNDEEAKYCGYNSDPQMGSGCDGGPAKVWVCGTCGILYDVVQPVFQQNSTGLLSQPILLGRWNGTEVEAQ